MLKEPWLIPISLSCQTPDLSTADATEEEKVIAMMSQAGEDFNPALWVPHSLGQEAIVIPLLLQLCQAQAPRRRGRRRRRRGKWRRSSTSWAHETTSLQLHLSSLWPEGSLDQAVSNQWGDHNYSTPCFRGGGGRDSDEPLFYNITIVCIEEEVSSTASHCAFASINGKCCMIFFGPRKVM